MRWRGLKQEKNEIKQQPTLYAYMSSLSLQYDTIPMTTVNSNDAFESEQSDSTAKVCAKHNLIAYDDVADFREAYIRVCKQRLEHNEVVIILPYYEMVGSIEQLLENIGVNVDYYKRAGSLFIVDAVREFFGADYDFAKFLKLLDKGAKKAGKSGVFVIANIDGFFLYEGREKLMQYEREIMKIDLANTRLICAYYKGNYDSLTASEKQMLKGLHDKIAQRL
jgi:hypothetical protein